MSKEKTPITAGEYADKNDFWFEREHNIALKFAEQYAQAKVLEALERFIDWCYTEEKNYKSKEELIRDFLKHK